jgi:hypothetical protein
VATGGWRLLCDQLRNLTSLAWRGLGGLYRTEKGGGGLEIAQNCASKARGEETVEDLHTDGRITLKLVVRR